MSLYSLLQAISKTISLDREAFPSLNGLRGDTHHSVRFNTFLFTSPSRKIIRATFFLFFAFCLFFSRIPVVSFVIYAFHSQYIADNRVENIPWKGVDEWALKVFRKIFE